MKSLGFNAIRVPFVPDTLYNTTAVDVLDYINPVLNPELIGKTVERGMTLVPTRMYFKNGKVKVALGLARGKQVHDKREAIKKRETDRETRAAVKHAQR